MSKVTYEVVEHDGGWAYSVGGAYSETFPSHEAASAAAQRAAAEQEQPGESEAIVYQASDGSVREEVARGNDRPDTEVVEKASR